MKCQYLGNEIKYEAESWYLVVIYDADFDYCIEIHIKRQIMSNLMTSPFRRQQKHKIANILVTN